MKRFRRLTTGDKANEEGTKEGTMEAMEEREEIQEGKEEGEDEVDPEKSAGNTDVELETIIGSSMGAAE